MPHLPTSDLLRLLELGGVLEALRAATDLRRRPIPAAAVATLLRLALHGDPLARTSAGYALARRRGGDVDRALLSLQTSDEESMRRTGALVFSERPRFEPAVASLRVEAAAGGLGGMLASLALEEWEAPARDRKQPLPLRSRARGLRVGQLFLQGRIDAGLDAVGAGDGGGLATLVVQLSRALGRRPEIDSVVTVARAFADEHSIVSHDLRHERVARRSSIERIAFGPQGYLATADMWPYRAEIERELEDALLRLPGLDVMHLRFADVGTFAAARVCRRLGIPVCFTLAADPHVVIRTAEEAGRLSRETFAEADVRERYLLRAHIVESMLEQAAGLVAFPRPDAAADVRELLGIELKGSTAGRLRIVSEGISIRTLDRAAAAAAGPAEPDVWDDLRRAVATLPVERAGLPLLLSVGRFHRVKGFDRLLEAWAGDPTLFAAFNLVLVGGDLERPTEEEAAVLRSLDIVEKRFPHARSGRLLLGHRSHDDVALLLRAARLGLDGAVAPDAIYACASDKEEFGLALLEALGAGLTVVAPVVGGPATYVEHGINGCLADTTSVGALRGGLSEAAGLRHVEGRAAAATALVRERFSIDGMAAQLTELYLDLSDSARLEMAA